MLVNCEDAQFYITTVFTHKKISIRIRVKACCFVHVYINLYVNHQHKDVKYLVLSKPNHEF